MSLRITTNGTLQTYKSNLMRSRSTLNSSIEKVLTQRKFNSYAEDPASASQAFQLRRSLWNTESQLNNSRAVINRYNTAWSAIDDVAGDLGRDIAEASALRGLSGSTASGRQPLGTTILSTADAVVKTMNVQYGDDFIFAGADGLNVPFSWSEDGTKLLYRGVDVNAAEGTADYIKLQNMAKETTYVDLGLGLSEDNNGKLIPASAFNTAMSGLDFLGYGMDEDGDPKNIVMLMKELGNIFSNCDKDTGAFVPAEDEETANRLTNKLNDALDALNVKYTELDAQGTFLNTNHKRLETTKDTLNEQVTSIEDIDPAEAITQLTYAQYCYNAALKIGNSILSQSLLDYMN